MEFSHVPVMAREALSLLACSSGHIYVDGTLGGGGHASEILKASSPDGRLVGIDRDEDALRSAAQFLKPYEGRFTLVRGNFREMGKVLADLGIGSVDGIILDLGVSSYQFDSPERGFSFRYEAPLDMRMDTRQALTAADLVNGLEKKELVRIFKEYGEEREAARIAGAIEKARAGKRIETTGDLVRIISAAVPPRFQARGIHPATRVFQALRIAVNDELGSLEEGLEAAVGSLKKGGRLVVITFHSLEDRIVKNAFRDLSTGCVCPPRLPQCVCGRKPRAKLLVKKAITPTDEEIDKNPRSRSAKLRGIELL